MMTFRRTKKKANLIQEKHLNKSNLLFKSVKLAVIENYTDFTWPSFYLKS